MIEQDVLRVTNFFIVPLICVICKFLLPQDLFDMKKQGDLLHFKSTLV